jgi:putative ABC transport system substrate-binding protein
MRRREFITLLGGAAAAWPVVARAQRERTRQIGWLLPWAENNSLGQATVAAFGRGLASRGWVQGKNVRLDYRFAAGDPDLFKKYAADLVSLSPDVILASASPAVEALKPLTRAIPIVFAAVSDPVPQGFVQSLARPGGNGDDIKRLPAIAQELVGVQPDIILTNSTPMTVAVQQATRTIPIVFASVSDPVASGIVPRLDRPSGNVTGFVNLEASLGGKWLELLTEIAPGLKRAAIMFNPDSAPVSVYMPSLETAAVALKVVPITAPVRSDAEIEAAMMALGREPGGGLIVMLDTFMVTHRAPIIVAAARNKVPAVYPQSLPFIKDGGLVSYGVDTIDSFRRAATYVDRILRGAKPAELPVQLPTKFEMVLNLKTAKALGLVIPAILQATADEVIE